MARIHAVRLTQVDAQVARALFQLMARVFDEPSEELGDEYLLTLLRRPDFWAVAAFMEDELVGGLTANTLPNTRRQSSEIFIYDVAVRADRQRRGVGRMLISTLLAAAEAEGIHDVFVPAENDDNHALEFYRALGCKAAAVTHFSFR